MTVRPPSDSNSLQLMHAGLYAFGPSLQNSSQPSNLILATIFAPTANPLIGRTNLGASDALLSGCSILPILGDIIF